MNTSKSAEDFLSLLTSKLGDMIVESRVSLGDAEIRIRADQVLECCKLLQLDADLRFDMLLNVTAVDYMDSDFIDRPEERFELVYHLLSIKSKYRLRIKVALGEKDPQVDSVTPLWAGADFMESEVWDMFGIPFEGHPDLRRILMYEEFKGFPLRKDYPIQGKQPRIPMRKPEVENTARQMLRGPLVKINRRNQERNQGIG